MWDRAIIDVPSASIKIQTAPVCTEAVSFPNLLMLYRIVPFVDFFRNIVAARGLPLLHERIEFVRR